MKTKSQMRLRLLGELYDNWILKFSCLWRFDIRKQIKKYKIRDKYNSKLNNLGIYTTPET